MNGDAAMLIPRRRQGPDMRRTDRGQARLDQATRARIEALIETLIEILDEADGDTDKENDDQAGCCAGDDNLDDWTASLMWRRGPGTDEDAEPERGY